MGDRERGMTKVPPRGVFPLSSKESQVQHKPYALQQGQQRGTSSQPTGTERCPRSAAVANPSPLDVPVENSEVM